MDDEATPTGVRRGAGQLLGAIFSASPDAIVVVDAAGKIVLSSPAVQELFGYFPEELVGEPVAILLPDDRRPRHDEHLRRYFAAPRARQMGAGLELAGRRSDGTDFPVDVSLTPVALDGASFVAAFVRDARERRHAIDRLHAVNEITRRLLGGTDAREILPFVASRARQLAGADAVWVVTPVPGDDLEICAVDGDGVSALLGSRLSSTASRSAAVMASGASALVDDLSSATNVPAALAGIELGPGLYVPLVADERRVGVLVLARRHGARGFEPLEIALAEVFASSTAAAIELGEARAELGRLEIVSEDERIARDLHDTVIQELFAIGLSLQATRASLAGTPASRVDAAISGIDEVIQEIRNTIFRLPGRTAGSQSLRDDLLALADKWRHELGFRPRVAFLGPVDAAIPEGVAAQIVPVVGEALANVARHARATAVEIVAQLDDGVLAVSVSDDGVGCPDGPSAGHGLRNLAARAANLGGSCEIEPRSPRGTVLTWSVPI